MDASEMLDMGEFDSDDSEQAQDDAPTRGPFDSEEEEQDSESGSGSEDDEDDEDDEEVDSEDDEEYAGALEKLNSFVEGLESKKRKVDDEDEEGGKKKKRVVLKERTEAWPEGEFVAVTAPDGVNQDKVNLEDLLSSFAGSKNPRLASLRKTLKPLAAISTTSSAATKLTHSHLKTPGPLAAPLPARLQDKVEREAAYEKTKEETDKWNATVRRMKGESGLGVEGARHERLTLPLMGPEGDVKRDANAAEWSAKFQPMNALESSIEALLSSGQMQPHDLRTAETLALAKLDPADVAARQVELRQQRDLMFRAERKAKRVAKIKSKAFRRIHRRAKGKGEEGKLDLEDMEELDKIDGGDRVAEERARMEVARAKERATLKHSTRGGRWSKAVGGIEGLDEERNTAVREMVKRGEELRKKIAGIESGDDEDEFGGDDGSEEDDMDADYDQIRGTAFDELAALDAKEARAAAEGPKAKGVVGMKFMQDAIARDSRKVQAETDELRRKLETMDQMQVDEEESEGEQDDHAATGISKQVQGNLGRMVFGPSGASMAQAVSTTEPKPSTEPSSFARTTTKLSGPLSIASTSRLSNPSPLSLGTPADSSSSNPWLALAGSVASSSGQPSRKMNKATVGKDSREANRSAARVEKHKSKSGTAREAEQDDARVEIDPLAGLAGEVVKSTRKVVPQIGQSSLEIAVLTGVSGKGKTGGKPGPTVRAKMEDDGDDSSDEEADEQQIDAQRGRGPAAFRQRELVAKAFAGDNVVADFEAEKRKEMERDAPKEEDNTLPGWGSWSGKGVKKAKNARKFVTKIPGIAPAARQDAKFSHVIISEKKDKKASKYMLKDLPFPYTSAAQHEHKLRTPLGPEWSTATILRDQTIPKVLIKPGVTIRPVSNKL